MLYNPRLQSLSEKDLLFFMMSRALLKCWTQSSEHMSVVAGAKLRNNWFWWDFGDRVYGRKGDALIVATTCKLAGALRCLQKPFGRHECVHS